MTGNIVKRKPLDDNPPFVRYNVHERFLIFVQSSSSASFFEKTSRSTNKLPGGFEPIAQVKTFAAPGM